MTTYLILDLKVSKASMLQTLSFITPAPVFAAMMAMHALDKKLNEILDIQGVGIIHRNAKPWIEQLPSKENYLNQELVQKRGAYTFSSKNKPTSNSMQPVALADLEWTLLLECAGSPRDSQQVENVLSMMRLAGGTIQRAKVSIYHSLDEALVQLRSGFWVDDVTDKLIKNSDNESKPLLVDLLKATQEESWIVPVTLGYVLFEEPSIRKGSRDGAKHSFVEALVGLIQYTSLRTKKANLTRENLWRYGWKNDHFITTNRSDLILTPTYTKPELLQSIPTVRSPL